MDVLATLKSISSEHKMSGTISAALEETAAILGDGIESMEALIRGCTLDTLEEIDVVCRHILDAGGKRIRPAICMLAHRVAGGNGALPVSLSASAELLHNASLLHDDVIDEGELRRGLPAARKVWGNSMSVLGGDFLLMRSVELVAPMGVDFVSKLVATLRALVEGEVIQLGKRGLVSTSRQDYFRIVEGKTSSLFAFAGYTGARSATEDPMICTAMENYGLHVGTAFQLIDDVLDFSARPETLGKNLLADIGEGKLTLPVILAMEEDPGMMGNLRDLVAGGDAAILAPCIGEQVLATGAIDRVKEQASEHTHQALENLRSFSTGQNSVADLLEKTALALLHRES